MSGIRRFLFRLQSVFRRNKLEGEMSEEIRVHMEMQTEAHIAAGMPADEARFAALRDFGGVEQVKEQYRDERRLRGLEDSARDLRQAVRRLLRERAFTATVLAIFALCAAANVAIFSVVNGILLRPLPFPDSGGILVVSDTYPKAGVKGGVSVPHYLERKQQVAGFAETAAWRRDGATLGGSGSPELVDAVRTTPSFFPLLRADAALGRTFTQDEGGVGRPRVVILSDELWRERFKADPAAVGQTLLIDNLPYAVIGVMPRGFRYLSQNPMIWMPLAFTDYEKLDGMRHANNLEMIVRLRGGVSIEEAQAEVDEVNQRTLKFDAYAKTVIEAGFRSVLRGLHSEYVSDIRPVLLLLQAGAAFLMLAGVVNLANLVLVRATARAREYSVRRALGASSFRLGRTLVLETLFLSVTGGMIGLGVGAAVLRATLSHFADRLPYQVPMGLDGTVGAVTFAAAVFLGLLLAVPALWQSLHGNFSVSLSSESRSSTTARAVHRFRNSLIVAQIALAFVLLAGSGLLGLSLVRVLAVNPGFVQENVLTGRVQLPLFRYPDEKQHVALAERLLGELRALPGVRAAGIDTLLPFTWDGGIMISFKGRVLTPSEQGQPHPVSTVAGDLFASLGIPLFEGRLIDDDDVQASRNVCVVDTDFARRYWPNGNALGHGISPDTDPNAVFFTIVGIVGPVKQADLTDQRARGAIYLPYGADPWFMVTLRTSQAPETGGAAIREAVARLDPELSVTDLKTMSARIDGSVGGRGISLALAAVFAGVALILTAVGIYGALAYTVAQRRREIGVRMALGANPGQIVRQFLGLGVRLLAIGLPVGCAGALLLARGMASFLFGVGPANPLVLVGTAAVLGGVAMLACVIPARRGSRVAPAEVLRS
jgi:predicted permease